jgi:hypothetical protein
MEAASTSETSVNFYQPDDRGRKRLWNVGKRLPDYTVQQPRRQPSSNLKRFTSIQDIAQNITLQQNNNEKYQLLLQTTLR